MKKIWMTGAVLALCGASFLAGNVSAQEDAGGMPAWMAKTAEHEELAKSVGDWDVSVKYWMAPGAPPTESKGTASFKQVMNGSFVRQDFKGNMMGMPYTGTGLTGFDTIDKKYTGLWMNSFSPVLSISSGTKNESGAIVYEAKEPNYMGPGKIDAKHTTKWDGDDKFSMTSTQKGPDGKDFQTMELTYTRKAAKTAEDE